MSTYIDQPNLQFRLVDQDGLVLAAAGDHRLISEPVGWDQLQMRLTRRDTEFGFNMEFSDGHTPLGFDQAAGLGLIAQALDATGPEANLRLQLGVDSGGFTAFFDSHLDLYTAERNDHMIRCGLKREDFGDRLRSRWDTPIDLLATETLDGDPVAAPTTVDMQLHSQELVLESSGSLAGFDTTYTLTAGEMPADVDFLAVLGADFNEIGYANGDEAFNNTPPAVVGNEMRFGGALYLNPNTNAAGQSTDYTVQVSAAADLSWEYSGGTPAAGSVSLVLRQEGPGITTVDRTVVSSGLVNFTGPIALAGQLPAVSMVVQDKQVVFRLLLVLTVTAGNPTTGQLVVNDLSLRGVWNSLAEPSTAAAMQLHEALDHGLHLVTGQAGALHSPHLGRTAQGYPADGAAAHHVLTNGFRLRQFAEAKPMSATWGQLFSDLQACLALGLGVERLANGTERVVVAPWDHFFQDHEVLSLEPLELESQQATELVYNSWQVGYRHFLLEELNTTEQLHGGGQWLPPVTKLKHAFTRECGLVTDGYALEWMRRKSFERRQTQRERYDDELFLIATSAADVTVPERDEELTAASGLRATASRYNLRHTVQRMLLRWLPWLRGGLHHQPGGTAVRSVSYPGKAGASTTYGANSFGEPQTAVVEGGAAPLAGAQGTYRPQWWQVRCRLSWHQLQALRQACQGQGPTPYGYVTFNDWAGTLRQGWIYELNYWPATEQADLQLLEKP